MTILEPVSDDCVSCAMLQLTFKCTSVCTVTENRMVLWVTVRRVGVTWHMPMLSNAINEIDIGGLDEFGEIVVVVRNFGGVAIPTSPCKYSLVWKICNSWPPGNTVFPAVQIWLRAGRVHAAERTSCHSSSDRWSVSRWYQGQALCCSVENGTWLCTPTTVSHLMCPPVSQLCYTTC